ncbi:MAG TPA: fibronectin type III domain-containing protein, partial [Desulfuromonadaceae bacterium]
VPTIPDKYLVYDGTTTSAYFKVGEGIPMPSQTWFVTVAAYNILGKTNLKYSAIKSCTVASLDPLDTVAPGTPQFTGYETELEIGSIQNTFAYITVNWSLDSMPLDFSNYIIAHKRTDEFIWTETYVKTASYRFSDLISGASYDFRIKAVDMWLNTSAWSAVKTIQAKPQI